MGNGKSIDKKCHSLVTIKFLLELLSASPRFLWGHLDRMYFRPFHFDGINYKMTSMKISGKDLNAKQTSHKITTII